MKALAVVQICFAIGMVGFALFLLFMPKGATRVFATNVFEVLCWVDIVAAWTIGWLRKKKKA